MREHSYFFEILDLGASFVSAFDDAFVFRYDANTREAKEKISVRYIFGPKHRVLYDLNDKAKVLTLPVVTIEHISLERDTSRIANKKHHLYRPGGIDGKISKIPMPIPINLELNVSVIAYYKEDIDQIVQNFIVNCDPYIIVPTKIPPKFGMDFIDEIRNEIQWSGNVTYDNPKNLDPNTKWRISADTSFTVKGWMFKDLDDIQAPIYVVKTNFHSVDLRSRTYTVNDYSSLSTNPTTETMIISAYPEFTNLFYSTSGKNISITGNLDILSENNNTFLILGKRFGYNNSWYLSGSVLSPYILTKIETARYPLISAYKIPEEFVTVYNDNTSNIYLPKNILSSGDFTFVTANSAGWMASDYVLSIR